MYHLGHHTKHRYWPLLIVGVMLIGGVIAGIVVARRAIQPDTSLTQSPPVIRHFAEGEAATQHVVLATFAIDLPANWRSLPAPATIANGYSWHGTAGRDAAVRLDIYLDHLPQDLAVNRLLPVQAAGDHLDIAGTVSENCLTFTDKTPQSVRTGSAPAKWDGVSFLCDTSNYERDVVAIGSAEGANTVQLTGFKSGAHQVLLVFTDNNIDPDFSVLSMLVRSFRLL